MELQESTFFPSDHAAKLQSSRQYGMVCSQRQKYRSMEQNWKSKINPHTSGQLIFDKGYNNIQWGEDNPFNK